MKFRILLLFITVSMLASCGKDDDNKETTEVPTTPPVVKNSHRIKQYNSYNLSAFGQNQTRITYDGEKISRISYYYNYTGEFVEYKRTEFSYSLNEVTSLVYQSSDNFKQPLEKHVYKFVNGMKTEYLRYIISEGVYHETLNTYYKYSNDKLVSYSKSALMDDNRIHEYERGIFTYDNGFLKSYTIRNFVNDYWQDKIKVNYFYENDKLIKWVKTGYESDEWIIKDTFEYLYNGNDLTTATFKEWNVTEPSFYKFENNYMVEIANSRNKYTYEYEQGHGNYNEIFLDPSVSPILHIR